jgi:hypothetical protein
MEMLELKQGAIGDIGFIDPNTVHSHGVKEFPGNTEDTLDNFLAALNTKSTLLFPYNLG